MAEKGMTAAEAGRKGGETTAERYGHEFYEEIGRKGGKSGGRVTRDRYGSEFYKEIGRKGGAKVKALIEEGKRAKANATAKPGRA